MPGRRRLNRQRFLVPLRRQLHAKGIDVECQHGIAAQESSQLDQALSSELGQGGIEGSLINPAGAEKLPALIYHGGLIGGQAGKLLLIPQSVDNVIAQSGPPWLMVHGHSRCTGSRSRAPPTTCPTP